MRSELIAEGDAPQDPSLLQELVNDRGHPPRQEVHRGPDTVIVEEQKPLGLELGLCSLRIGAAAVIAMIGIDIDPARRRVSEPGDPFR